MGNNKNLIKTVFLILFLLNLKFSFAQIRAIEEALILKDYATAIRLADLYLNKDSSEEDKALFLLGEAYIGNGSLVKARETFRSLYKKYPSSLYTPKAILRIADSFYLEGNYSQAKKIYNYFLNKYPESKLLSYAYLHLIYCEEKLGNWDLKKKYMKILEERYSDSIEASKLAELKRRGFKFIVQIGAFTERKNALNLVNSLKRKGFSAYIDEEKENGKIFYKVRAGEFLKRKEAQNLVEVLLDKGFPAQIFP
ncbi:MAG: hypothetical protein DRP76_02205 [Candidatus Omnitrophota bacterium]|nr:MAG: hypothetical protein DRP76_02205 [Candidatus Omnitrophota bacterium]RKY43485.1 MAG: hypothetical protein DRP80_05055 [Candidatus Omnitrophota bacterium]HEC70041.1 tetratricopeptide repeat protein [Candidatus Omnitrophota bacterium]